MLRRCPTYALAVRMTLVLSLTAFLGGCGASRPDLTDPKVAASCAEALRGFLANWVNDPQGPRLQLNVEPRVCYHEWERNVACAVFSDDKHPDLVLAAEMIHNSEHTPEWTVGTCLIGVRSGTDVEVTPAQISVGASDGKALDRTLRSYLAQHGFSLSYKPADQLHWQKWTPH